jgi:epoxyqueuosine reductase
MGSSLLQEALIQLKSNSSNKQTAVEWLKEFGVTDFGYTEEGIPTTTHEYNHWVTQKKHLPLTYLEGERQEKRQHLKNHWDEFQSAVVFLFSYHKTHYKLKALEKNDPDWNGLKLASYTLGFDGLDYHHLLKDQLMGIGERLKQEYDLEYRLTLDTHPILERDLAKRAGLGWFGKNSMMINRDHGSFFIIGSLLLNKKLDLEKNQFETDHCGQCTRCIEACPTEAIDPVNRTIIAKDCISTFTIEQFKLESIPSEKMDLSSGEIFGCDICQDVCPWNKRVDRIMDKENISNDWMPQQQKILDYFMLRPIKMLHQDLEATSGKTFEKVFKQTSFERSGRRGLLKNIRFYLQKKA